MKRTRKRIILSAFFMGICMGLPAHAQEDSLLLPQKQIEINNTFKMNPNANMFSLANIVDNILNNDTTETENTIDKKSAIRKDFFSATSKFNQGNAVTAYDEYESLLDKIDNDTSLFTLSRVFYEIGFFSLANKATEKIVYKNQFYSNISDLEKSYKPKSMLDKEQEIFFAKTYSSIYFDNSASESLSELVKLKQKYNKNDYYNFMLSRAYLEAKKYSEALNSINKAISLNPDNINYQVHKVDVFLANEKYSDAEHLIKKIKSKYNNVNFADNLEIKEQVALLNLTKNEKDKKFYSANKNFLEGNFEKTKKDCLGILNFDKNNDKVISLLAKSELALGNVERANVNFVSAYKEEKNNPDTLMGLGDIKFLHGDYQNALKTYKKVYSKDKNNYEALIKLATAEREYGKKQKELKKLEQKLDKMPKNEYLSYYKSAISIAQKNPTLKEDFLKKALEINPAYENALGELIELHLKNKNYELAKGLIYNVSFTLKKNYYYYYLCGLYNQATNKKKDAIQFYKTSLNLNPGFEIANTKLLKLIPDMLNEEM